MHTTHNHIQNAQSTPGIRHIPKIIRIITEDLSEHLQARTQNGVFQVLNKQNCETRII